MGGGDLLNLLIEKDVFDENFTRFYVAEVCRSTWPPFLQTIDSDRWSWPSSLVINMALFTVTSSLT